MKAIIYVNGVIGEDTNLLDIIRQFKSYKGVTEVEAHIDSVGGSVDVGQSIFNYLRNLNVPVTTIANKAYSIAATIFMAGDIRLVEEGADRVMIHMPWAMVQGGSEDLEMVSKELKAIENDFVKFYSTYTSIDEGSIKDLLKNETFLNADEAVEIGLATGKKETLQAVAFYNKQENKEMTKTEKFLNAMNAFFNGESEIKALIIQDANADEINFSEVAEDAQPIVGDKAVDADNKPIEGERVLPTGETYIFENGVLTEIKPAEEVEEEEEAPVEEVAEAVAEEEIDLTAILEKLTASISEKITAKFDAENKELKAEITALKKLIGSDDAAIVAQNIKTNTNTKDLAKGIQGLINLKK